MKLILVIIQLILLFLECWFYFVKDDFLKGMFCNFLILLIMIINILI